MKNRDLIQRITLNPAICFGKPTIRNMRYPAGRNFGRLSGIGSG